LFLIAWTIFTAYMTVAAIRTSVAVLAVFVVLTATFLALTVATYSESVGLAHLGGWLGLATAALAWYASFAGVANATFQKTVLPVGPANAK
jgi:succinate-acetate transporter protein